MIFKEGIFLEGRKPKHCIEGCSRLRFTSLPANRPSAVDATFWAQATATGEICGDGNTGHIEISGQGLIPLGVYTVFFTTDRGPIPAAPTGADYTSDGFDPNRLVVNGNGILNYYIAPLNFNPFSGIPVTGGIATIQGVTINFHGDRSTNGLSPGTNNVNVFDQLLAPFCYPHREEDI
jgi:hypothetical protein